MQQRPQSGAPAETRRVRPRLRERCRHDSNSVRGLLSDDDPQRGDRPQHVARPQGRARRLSGVYRRGHRPAGDALSGGSRPRPTRPYPRCLRCGLHGGARRGRAGGFQGEGQGVRADVRLSRLDPAVHARGVGNALHLSELPRAEAPRAGGSGLVQRHPRVHRHGQLPG